MPYSNPDSVIRELWRSTMSHRASQIHVILDAARDESIYPAVMDFRGEYCCLYGEEVPQVLAEASPYLVKLQPGDDFTVWLISQGWGDNWGIFLGASVSLEEIRQHFRELLKVKDEDGKEFFFRYYDPRVLRVYLPTCDETQLEMMFGPVDSLLVEGEDANTLIEYSYNGSKLTGDVIPLGT